MAGMVDRLRKKSKGGTPQKDWTNSGSFINKPSRGWLHPDEQLAPDVGVCYGVRVSTTILKIDCKYVNSFSF